MLKVWANTWVPGILPLNSLVFTCWMCSVSWRTGVDGDVWLSQDVHMHSHWLVVRPTKQLYGIHIKCDIISVSKYTWHFSSWKRWCKQLRFFKVFFYQTHITFEFFNLLNCHFHNQTSLQLQRFSYFWISVL